MINTEKFPISSVVNFVNAARTNGVVDFFVTDYATMKATNSRHLRMGMIPFGEGKGRRVKAYGLDELNNVVLSVRMG